MFSECSRLDVLFLTDSWNRRLTYQLYTQIARLVRSHSTRAHLGLMTSSSDSSQEEFNISMTGANAFLQNITQYRQSFCCAKITDLLVYAMNEFGERTIRRRVPDVVLYVTHDDALNGDTLEDIVSYRRTALSTSVDK